MLVELHFDLFKAGTQISPRAYYNRLFYLYILFLVSFFSFGLSVIFFTTVVNIRGRENFLS